MKEIACYQKRAHKNYSERDRAYEERLTGSTNVKVEAYIIHEGVELGKWFHSSVKKEL